MKRLAEPAPLKVTKALPKPDEVKKARRGGKRFVPSYLEYNTIPNMLTLFQINLD